MRRAAAAVLLVAVALAAGGAAALVVQRTDDGGPADATPVDPDAGDRPAACPTWRATRVGTLADPSLDEVSGLVASVAHPGVLWAHEDSGAPAEVVALTPAGDVLARVALAGARNVDWEDLALGPGPEPGRAHLYVGDVGDNAAARPSVALHRIPEPDPRRAPAGAVPVETITLVYPDGPRDAEALLVDPVTGDAVVVTKRLDGRAEVFRAPAPLAAGRATTLEPVATLDLGVGGLVTAADATPDGSLVAVRTYGALHLWSRAPGTSIAEALAGPRCRAALLTDGQGESLALAPDGGGAWTVPEGTGAAIRRLEPAG